MPPTVSILLPVFNAAQTLATCLKSIRRQTFIDWECIIVDDGSGDASIETAVTAAASDPRFIIVRREHAGLIETLNAGIDRCSGDLVARMDADDWMHRDRLKLQARALADDESLEIVGAHIRYFPRSGLGDGSREYEGWLNSMRSRPTCTENASWSVRLPTRRGCCNARRSSARDIKITDGPRTTI